MSELKKSIQTSKGKKNELDFLEISRDLATSLGHLNLGESQYEAFKFNAKIAELQAMEAREAGDARARLSDRRYAQLRGTQRAAFGARGVDVSQGTPAQVQADTDMIRAEEHLAIQNSAWREAWGHSARAASYRLQGERARSRGQQAGIGGLIKIGVRIGTSLLSQGSQFNGGGA